VIIVGARLTVGAGVGAELAVGANVSSVGVGVSSVGLTVGGGVGSLDASSIQARAKLSHRPKAWPGSRNTARRRAHQ